MAGFATVQVNFIQFNRAMVDLQRISGQTMKQVLRSETTEILNTCVKRTKVADKGVVQRKEQLGVIKKENLTQASYPGQTTVNAGWRLKAPYGRVWIKVRPGGKKSFILARGADFSAPSGPSTLKSGRDWLEFVNRSATVVSSKVPGAIAKGWASIGLARKAWVQMAESMRLNLRNLAEGENASAFRAKYQNGIGIERQTKTGYVITLINKLPYGRRAKMDVILARAINQRGVAFYKAVSAGVFQSAKRTLARYPGLYVS